MSDITKRLLNACNGHPDAKIAWPHRLLHDAVDEVERLRSENESFRSALLGARPFIEARCFEHWYDKRVRAQLLTPIDVALGRQGDEG
jgi:hypothetical protein